MLESIGLVLCDDRVKLVSVRYLEALDSLVVGGHELRTAGLATEAGRTSAAPRIPIQAALRLNGIDPLEINLDHG
jgi:hypothetical protein